MLYPWNLKEVVTEVPMGLLKRVSLMVNSKAKETQTMQNCLEILISPVQQLFKSTMVVSENCDMASRAAPFSTSALPDIHKRPFAPLIPTSISVLLKSGHMLQSLKGSFLEQSALVMQEVRYWTGYRKRTNQLQKYGLRFRRSWHQSQYDQLKSGRIQTRLEVTNTRQCAADSVQCSTSNGLWVYQNQSASSQL